MKATFFVGIVALQILTAPADETLVEILAASENFLQERVRELRGWVPTGSDTGYYEPARAIMPDAFIMDEIITSHLLSKIAANKKVDIQKEWQYLWEEHSRRGSFSPTIFDHAVAKLWLSLNGEYCLPLPEINLSVSEDDEFSQLLTA